MDIEPELPQLGNQLYPTAETDAAALWNDNTLKRLYNQVKTKGFNMERMGIIEKCIEELHWSIKAGIIEKATGKPERLWKKITERETEK